MLASRCSRSVFCAVSHPEEKCDYNTNVLVWLGEAEKGRWQKEFVDDLTDVSSDEASSQATPPSTVAEVEKLGQTTFARCNCKAKGLRGRAGPHPNGKRSRQDAAMPTSL